MLKIIIAIIFGVPAMVWACWLAYAGWAFIFKNCKAIIRAIGNIHLNHEKPGGNGLIWDYKTKTMYGHHIMVTEKKEE
jgi:hypothetical protein